jgi:pimeloyl-ACP methyl ester carboxylesterase
MWTLASIALTAGAVAAAEQLGKVPPQCEQRKGTARSSDGVPIAYSACGEGEPALVFMHGGLADRTFWSGQLSAFCGRHRVVALDLAGHGESGAARPKWGMPQFGEDVRAVIEAEKIGRVVLVGNSLGGPVAIEAALLLPGKTMAVVGVDTFQDLGGRIEGSEARSYADAWRKDFDLTLEQMIRRLFHADTDPAFVASIKGRMSSPVTRAVLPAMFESFAGYDVGAAAQRVKAPIRCINGDLFPTDVEALRRIVPDFDAAVFSHTGHYPMLERTEEFNRKLREIVDSLKQR